MLESCQKWRVIRKQTIRRSLHKHNIFTILWYNILLLQYYILYSILIKYYWRPNPHWLHQDSTIHYEIWYIHFENAFIIIHNRILLHINGIKIIGELTLILNIDVILQNVFRNIIWKIPDYCDTYRKVGIHLIFFLLSTFFI